MFDGKVRGNRAVSSAGKKRESDKGTFLENTRKQREDRAVERKRLLAVVRLQSFFRRCLTRRAVTSRLRAEVDKKVSDITRIQTAFKSKGSQFNVPLDVLMGIFRSFLFSYGVGAVGVQVNASPLGASDAVLRRVTGVLKLFLDALKGKEGSFNPFLKAVEESRTFRGTKGHRPWEYQVLELSRVSVSLVGVYFCTDDMNQQGDDREGAGVIGGGEREREALSQAVELASNVLGALLQVQVQSDSATPRPSPATGTAASAAGVGGGKSSVAAFGSPSGSSWTTSSSRCDSDTRMTTDSDTDHTDSTTGKVSASVGGDRMSGRGTCSDGDMLLCALFRYISKSCCNSLRLSLLSNKRDEGNAIKENKQNKENKDHKATDGIQNSSRGDIPLSMRVTNILLAVIQQSLRCVDIPSATFKICRDHNAAFEFLAADILTLPSLMAHSTVLSPVLQCLARDRGRGWLVALRACTDSTSGTDRDTDTTNSTDSIYMGDGDVCILDDYFLRKIHFLNNFCSCALSQTSEGNISAEGLRMLVTPSSSSSSSYSSTSSSSSSSGSPFSCSSSATSVSSSSSASLPSGVGAGGGLGTGTGGSWIGTVCENLRAMPLVFLLHRMQYQPTSARDTARRGGGGKERDEDAMQVDDEEDVGLDLSFLSEQAGDRAEGEQVFALAGGLKRLEYRMSSTLRGLMMREIQGFSEIIKRRAEKERVRASTSIGKAALSVPYTLADRTGKSRAFTPDSGFRSRNSVRNTLHVALDGLEAVVRVLTASQAISTLTDVIDGNSLQNITAVFSVVKSYSKILVSSPCVEAAYEGVPLSVRVLNSMAFGRPKDPLTRRLWVLLSMFDVAVVTEAISRGSTHSATVAAAGGGGGSSGGVSGIAGVAGVRPMGYTTDSTYSPLFVQTAVRLSVSPCQLCEGLQSTLYLLSCVLSHQLTATDDEEFFEESSTFPTSFSSSSAAAAASASSSASSSAFASSSSSSSSSTSLSSSAVRIGEGRGTGEGEVAASRGTGTGPTGVTGPTGGIGGKSLPLRDLKLLIPLLKTVLFRLYWSHPLGDHGPPSALSTAGGPLGGASGSSLVDLQTRIAVTRLFNQLYTRNERRSFLSETHWHLNRIPLLDAAAVSEVMANTDNSEGSDEPYSSSSSSRSETIQHVRTLLSCIPQVVPFDQRITVFQSLLQIDKVNFFSSDGGGGMMAAIGMGGSVQVKVHRDSIVEDAFLGLRQAGARLKGRVQVEFIGEAGIDGGGLFKEFIDSFLKAAFDPALGLFCASSGQLLVPSPVSMLGAEKLAFATSEREGLVSYIEEENGKLRRVGGFSHLSFFHFLGKMLGKALYESILVEPQFSSVFLNLLLGRTNQLDDLQHLDETMHRSLMAMKHAAARGEDVASWGLTFEVDRIRDGVTVAEDLLADGKPVLVTRDNMHAFIHRKANHKLNMETAEQSRAFLIGFREMIPVDWIRMFSAKELQLLISGDKRPIDIADMRRHINYAGGYHDSQPYIESFWEVVSSMTAEEQGELLQFVTSCPRQPLRGFGQLSPLICVQKVSPYSYSNRGPPGAPAQLEEQGPGAAAARLPSAATCMNLLKLPQYESVQQLREKLLYAIKSHSGFELS